MALESISVCETTVWYRKMIAGPKICQTSECRSEVAHCALTGRKIEEGEQVYLLLNNWDKFDNCWAIASEVDSRGWTQAITMIIQFFREYVDQHADSADYRRRFGDSPHALARTISRQPAMTDEQAKGGR